MNWQREASPEPKLRRSPQLTLEPFPRSRWYRKTLDRLTPLPRGLGESYSDVILRLAKG